MGVACSRGRREDQDDRSAPGLRHGGVSAGRAGSREVVRQAVTPSSTHRAIDAVWRIESARLIAGLARMVRDVGLAEDLAQDALVAALEQWPESGVPDNPGAWLMATAKNRTIDLSRRASNYERKREEIAHELRLMMAMEGASPAGAAEDEVGDDL